MGGGAGISGIGGGAGVSVSGVSGRGGVGGGGGGVSGMVGAEGSFWGSGVDEKGSKLGLGTGAGDVAPADGGGTGAGDAAPADGGGAGGGSGGGLSEQPAAPSPSTKLRQTAGRKLYRDFIFGVSCLNAPDELPSASGPHLYRRARLVGRLKLTK